MSYHITKIARSLLGDSMEPGVRIISARKWVGYQWMVKCRWNW